MRKELLTAIENTCAGVSPAEMMMAKRITAQMLEIAKHCMDGRVKLTKLMIDDKVGLCIPIFSTDNIESLVNRYLKFYPREATIMVKDFQDSIRDNESGWTKAKLMKRDFSMPARLKAWGQAIAWDFWEANNCENMKRFKQLCPKLATRRKNL